MYRRKKPSAELQRSHLTLGGDAPAEGSQFLSTQRDEFRRHDLAEARSETTVSGAALRRTNFRLTDIQASAKDFQSVARASFVAYPDAQREEGCKRLSKELQRSHITLSNPTPGAVAGSHFITSQSIDFAAPERVAVAAPEETRARVQALRRAHWGVSDGIRRDSDKDHFLTSSRAALDGARALVSSGQASRPDPEALRAQKLGLQRSHLSVGDGTSATLRAMTSTARCDFSPPASRVRSAQQAVASTDTNLKSLRSALTATHFSLGDRASVFETTQRTEFVPLPLPRADWEPVPLGEA